MQPYESPTVTLMAADYRALRARIADLEEQLRIERQRRQALDATAREAFKLAAWGGAKTTNDPR